MIEVRDRIEKAYDEVSIISWKKSLKEKSFFFGWMGGTAILLMLVSAYLIAESELNIWVAIGCLSWVVIGFIAVYLNFISSLKKSFKRMGISPPPGLFTFSTKEYREYKLRQFYIALSKENLLLKSSNDIELTELYIDFFSDEAKDSTRVIKFAAGSVILSFCIPWWNQYLAWKSKNNDIQKVNEMFFVSLVLLIAFSLMIIGFSFFGTIVYDYLNQRSHKFKDISKQLRQLHINLKLKYSGKDDLNDLS